MFMQCTLNLNDRRSKEHRRDHRKYQNNNGHGNDVKLSQTDSLTFIGSQGDICAAKRNTGHMCTQHKHINQTHWWVDNDKAHRLKHKTKMCKIKYDFFFPSRHDTKKPPNFRMFCMWTYRWSLTHCFDATKEYKEFLLCWWRQTNIGGSAGFQTSFKYLTRL